MDQLADGLLTYIADHPRLAALIVGVTSFGESFPFLNFIVPGGAVLIGAGALVEAKVLEPAMILFAATAGAVIGDAAAYGAGRRFGSVLPGMWPFRKHPEVLPRGTEFFHRYGQASVFIGRFFGPMRAVVPVTAGIVRMRSIPFMVATAISALIWAPILLGTGYLLSSTLASGWSIEQKVLAIGAAVVVAVAGIFGARRLFHVTEIMKK